ncbi:MAG: flagellar basal body rod protein FlgB [Alphaproteobacteria bacterium]|nr:MAG: flagellar basal body rod protein FlgB [Alphaproteobacteria bacterium]
MDLNGLKLFSALQRKMGWLTHRQRLVAENLANANTPNYRPRDLKTLRFADALTRSSSASAKLAITHPNHMKAPTQSVIGGEYEVRSIETKRNGNAVALDQELAKLAQVQMDYTAMVNLYRKHVAMIRTALGRSGG